MNLKLKSLKFTEKSPNGIEIEINNLELQHSFSLLIGDNAQGKTRVINFLKFMNSLVGNSPRIVTTNVNAVFNFFVNDSENLLIYEIDVANENGKNIYKENITRHNELIYSSSDKILINETTGKPVGTFFIPSNVPVISAIDDSVYFSIVSINSFFSRIVFVSSDKRNEFNFASNQIHPNELGTNISSVLLTWATRFPHLANETLFEFKRCFDFIDEIGFANFNIHDSIELIIYIQEKGHTKLINITEWSNGMLRILHLLMLPNIPVIIKKDETLHPSLILVDEIENGLDYKRLRFIIKFLENYSDDMQIIITSHSPLVCDFIHPKNWIVIKRQGTTLYFNSPFKVEENLEEDLELFKHNHWEFYSRHINNSDDYNTDENTE